MAQERSIVQVVDQILNQAYKMRASDVHVEQTNNNLRIRFRIDGLLYDQEPINQTEAGAVIARIKVLSQLDLAQRRMPQDGKFIFYHEAGPIDCRVSTFPAVHGEKAVVRLLDTHKEGWSLEQLGMNDAYVQTFKQLLDQECGFILVAGPTGSGKTTTLYAALSYLNTAQKNIVTLEDPIEYHIPGINQGHIHPQAGFTFAKGMRAVLRQDPDIIMVGEIRDQETARIALEAALTGHLVLSTVHTRSAFGVITRLLDIGIEPFLLSAALTGVVAQRLVRILCSACKVKQAECTMAELMQKYNVTEPVYGPVGCQQCSMTGYKGRTGIFEMLKLEQALKDQLVQDHTRAALCSNNDVQKNVNRLLDDGIKKVRTGSIALHELVGIVEQ